MRTREARVGQRGEERRESWGRKGFSVQGREWRQRQNKLLVLKSVFFRTDVIFPQGYSERVTGPELQQT